jgi:hypothetical protein
MGSPLDMDSYSSDFFSKKLLTVRASSFERRPSVYRFAARLLNSEPSLF